MNSSQKRPVKVWVIGGTVLVIVVLALAALLIAQMRLKGQDTASDTMKKQALTAALQGQTPVDLMGSLAASVNEKSLAEDTVVGDCECVTFVVYELFRQRMQYVAPATAEDLATEAYWTQKDADNRYRLTGRDNVQPGDVIIMAHDAIVYPWNNNISYWDFYFKENPGSIGKGAGHIGIVKKAEYWSDFGGWYIVMTNTNWPSYRSTAWSTDSQTKTYTDRLNGSTITCKNIQTSEVFVPSGTKVSFWRKK